MAQDIVYEEHRGAPTAAEMVNSATFHLTDVDRQVLAQTDEEFHLHTWDDLKQIISENRLDLFKRRPSDLKRYIVWTSSVRKQYGSSTAYLLQTRLHWTPLPSSDPDAGPKFAYRNPTPFADPDDYRVLKNDWPYGLADGIVHICVWLKTPIPVTPDTGDLTERSREIVAAFVERVFVGRLREVFGEEAMERVLWFKNWTGLQSVRGIDHVHVLVRDAPEEVLRDWTR